MKKVLLPLSLSVLFTVGCAEERPEAPPVYDPLEAKPDHLEEAEEEE